MSTQDPNRVEVAARRLRRLETFLDVVYAVLFVHFIMYLPKTEDMAWMQLPWGLLSLLIDNRVELLRLFIAVGLTLISWNLTHKLLSPLQRTDGLHTICTLVQLVLVCLFLFFAVADPTLSSVSSPVGQSLCLAMSGFVGLIGWRYARRQGLVAASDSGGIQGRVERSMMIEPLTALLNTGLAFMGPAVWTAGWFVLPVILIGVRSWIDSHQK